MPNRQVPRFRPCPGPAITATCPGTISGTSHQPVGRDRQLKQLGWRWFPALHPPGLDRLSELRAQRHQIRAAENDGGAVENLHGPSYPRLCTTRCCTGLALLSSIIRSLCARTIA